MPPRRAPGRGRERGCPPLQRLPHRLPEDAEEESSVHSSPTNENLNVDPPPPPQWQQVPPPPCSPYEAFMDWRQRFETQIPQYEAAQPPVGQGQYVPPPPPVYGGTVILFRNYARALIDTGAEHSYVSYGFAQYADIPLSPLFPELIVQTPFGESLLKTEVYRECALLVGHMVFEAYLIPLEIYDFDVILGMDWLNKHGA
ncbi:Retroviral aspartyl protease [Corchorus olitorius]|uniref:Retroviral aspartyl protease n=1 Tax=Corchorus olitorius TaxID=93759 RepID=A0A1R3IXB4_9ROSI|nr:Retroviral aspartyl protease [Corchorus olitorius]